MKRIAMLLICVALLAAIFTGCNKTTPYTPGSDTAATETTGSTAVELLSGLHYVEIEVADYGTMTLELDADTAPVTVTNFVTLAKEGFYDGLTFHRVRYGFMIQGGDPLGNGTGGTANKIKGEFAENGVENNISHVRGVISMARASDPNSASCQFFIVHQDSTYLDGKYAGFGRVTSGIEVVDAICEDSDQWEMGNMNVLTNPEQQPVITAIRVIEGGN